MTEKAKVVTVLTASFIFDADPRVEEAIELAIGGAWSAGRVIVQRAVGGIAYAALMYLKATGEAGPLEGIPAVVNIETHVEVATEGEMANAMLSAEVKVVGTEDGPLLVPVTFGNA